MQRDSRNVCATAVLWAACLSSSAAASSCNDASRPLDFWVGHWDVFVDGKLDGRNYIERTLDGCALLEHWDDASGMKGMSLFYLEPHTQQWKQVWVTDHARDPGGLKEKTLIFAAPGQARFQGIVWPKPDRMVIDRTTLRKLGDDEVSQLIEFSSDGGTSWTKAYDAVYRRAPQ